MSQESPCYERHAQALFLICNRKHDEINPVRKVTRFKNVPMSAEWTVDYSRSFIEIEAFMVDDSRSCILDSFPGEKRQKEAFKAPCICFNVLAEAFRRYSEKVTF